MVHKPKIQFVSDSDEMGDVINPQEDVHTVVMDIPEYNEDCTQYEKTRRNRARASRAKTRAVILKLTLIASLSVILSGTLWFMWTS